MGSISIQGVDEQLTALLKQQATKARTSVNQFILDALKKHVGLENEKKFSKEYDDLDHLFGSWSEEEFSEIQGTISSERRIDPELWQCHVHGVAVPLPLTRKYARHQQTKERYPFSTLKTRNP